MSVTHSFSIQTAIIGAAMGSLLLAITLTYCSSQDRDPVPLRLWSAAFFLNFFRLASNVLFGQDEGGWASFIPEALHATEVTFLFAGTMLYLGLPFVKRLAFILWISAVSWCLVVSFWNYEFLLLAIPIYWAAGSALIAIGVSFWRNFRKEHFVVEAVIAVAFIAWGLHKMDYFLLRQIPVMAPFGFMLSEAFSITIALCLIILTQNRQRRHAIEAEIQAKDNERKYHQSENYLRMLEDNIADGVISAHSDGKIISLNPVAKKIFGYHDNDIKELEIVRILPSVADNGYEENMIGRRKDGSYVFLDTFASAMDVEGETRHIVVVRDAHDKRLSEGIENLIHQIYKKVLQGASIDEIMELFCIRLVDLFDLPLAWAGTKERDGSIKVRAAVGEDANYVKYIVPRWDERDNNGLGPTGRAVRSGETQIVTASTDTEYGNCLHGTWKRGFMALAAIPLNSHDQVIGVLDVYSRHSSFDPRLMRRLEAVATRGGIAMRMAIDQRQLRLQGAAMAAAASAIFITDAEGKIEWINQSFSRISGYSFDEVLGKNPRLLKSGQTPSSEYEGLWKTISQGKVWRGEIVERRKDGISYIVQQTITPVRDSHGRIAHYVAVQEDVTERKQAEERIRYLSHYDTLTGLPNRMMFHDRLHQAISIAQSCQASLAVLFLDLNHFSRVNDTMGHTMGDRLLIHVVGRLGAAAGDVDTIARVGGDEFALILNDISHSEMAAIIAQRLIAALGSPFDIGGQELRIGSSIGIAIYPDDGDSPEQLIKNADMAMYKAMEEGGDNYRFYSADMNKETQAIMGLENDLRRALEKGELCLHYQPIIDPLTGKISAFEALARWPHREFGLIPPGRFIPIAESSGLIVPMGEWFIRKACEQIKTWQKGGLMAVPIAVNLSAAQFAQHDLAVRIESIIAESGIEPGMLELELTESMLMQDAGATARILGQLHELKIPLSIDDFGTGYSSFSYLRSFPVSKLKIDQSFTKGIPEDNGNGQISKAIIDLGHNLGLKIVSEGVETKAQFDFLKENGSDLIQGFLFSPAVPYDQATDYLRDGINAASN